MSVRLYAIGLLHVSACAPVRMGVAEVATEVDGLNPTGLKHGWVVEAEAFATGEPNPCPCNDHPETRRHWLLTC